VQDFPAPPAAEINKHVLAINYVLRLQRTSGQIKNIDLTETAALTQLVVDLQRLTGLLRFKTNGRISLRHPLQRPRQITAGPCFAQYNGGNIRTGYRVTFAGRG